MNKTVYFLLFFFIIACNNSINSIKQFDFENEGGVRLGFELDKKAFLNEKSIFKLGQKEFDLIDKVANETITNKAFFEDLFDADENNNFRIFNRLEENDLNAIDLKNNKEKTVNSILEIFNQTAQKAIDKIAQKLNSQHLLFNLFLTKDARVMVELKEANNRDLVLNTILGIGESIQFYETIDFIEAYSEIMRINKSLGDSLNFPIDENNRALIFDSKLHLYATYKDNQFTDISNHSIQDIGFADAKDTSFINNLFESSSEFKNKNIHYGWNEETQLNTSILKLFLMKIPASYKNISSSDILSTQLNKSDDFYFSIELILRDESVIKWTNLTRENIYKTVPMAIGHTILCAPVVNDVIEGNRVQISTINKTQTEVFYEQINASLCPYPLILVEETLVRKK